MGELAAMSSFDRDTCLLRDTLFMGCMFMGFMSSRAGLVTTFEMLKLTAFCGLFLFTHEEKIYISYILCGVSCS